MAKSKELGSPMVPMSREVRLAHGVTEGYLEDFLFQAHTGPTSDLIPLMAHAELFVQNERSKAVEELERRVIGRMMIEGYLTTDMVRDEVRIWHENEVLDLPQKEEFIEEETS